jgi:hypothetical protein
MWDAIPPSKRRNGLNSTQAWPADWTGLALSVELSCTCNMDGRRTDQVGIMHRASGARALRLGLANDLCSSTYGHAN